MSSSSNDTKGADRSRTSELLELLVGASDGGQENASQQPRPSRVGCSGGDGVVDCSTPRPSPDRSTPRPSPDRLTPRPSPDRLTPRPSPLGGSDRTVSTAVRLERQGFRASLRLNNNFAVKSIARGSEEWHSTLRPFVADLAFKSLVQRRFQSEVSFQPYTCHAAVLFVDLCDYSRIAAAVSHKGAHTLSCIVNAYLTRLLDIVRVHGGDVIKFAGDAVLVIWEGQEQDLGINLIIAAKCVMEMQKKAGQHPVEGNSLCFRIHCGLCCGLLESEIFAAPNHVHMQRLYHSVGGESMVEISELVGIAKAGEVCISDSVAQHLGARGMYRSVDGISGCKILTKLVLDHTLVDQVDAHVEVSVFDRTSKRQKKIEQEFIHPCVIQLLNHGGLSPTQISQMRNLCVLFIAMTSNGSSVNWLLEVQMILDKNRCPSK
jgi:class 3 adenylate cyclase